MTGTEAAVPESESFDLVRFVVLRLIAFVYAVAFASLLLQIEGLIGRNGISPAANFLSALSDAARESGQNRFWLSPTVFWLNASDAALSGACIAGVIFSLVALAGVAMRPCFVIVWILYRSIVSVGGDFLSFQWDILLLEVGCLCIFFAGGALFDAPWQVPRLKGKVRPASTIVLWLFRLLLFKLMFMSGMVKLKSGDPTWWNLTALHYHYLTQPLPTPLAWLADKLPDLAQKSSVAIMFAVELLVPFLIFTTRRLRQAAAIALIGLQLLIALTGNYTFFNVLTATLCLTLFNDAAMARLLPSSLVSEIRRRIDAVAASGDRSKAIQSGSEKDISERAVAGWKVRLRARSIGYGYYLLACLIGALNLCCFLPVLRSVPPVNTFYELFEPFNLVNSYGLFAVMTTQRREIIVEGSNDGKTWLAYEFPFKPGDLRRSPPIVAPYQPRLDWQMWFAALGSIEYNRWFLGFMVRLMQGSPEVLKLLSRNPFPSKPPLMVRAMLYDYHFSSFDQLTRQGAWWTRTEAGTYCQPMMINTTAGQSIDGRGSDRRER